MVRGAGDGSRLLILDPDGGSRDGEMRLTDGGAELEVGGETVRVRVERFSDGRMDAHVALQRLGAELARSGRRLVACGSCGRFQFSGMSRDMSGGQVGYCLRVGHRNRRGAVHITHRCGEHVQLDGWDHGTAWALDALLGRQKAARDEGRVGAYEGAMVGLAVGDALGFPCEFRSRAQILEAFPPDGVTGFVALHDERWGGGVLIAGRAHPPGTFSDDTQMSIAVARALLSAPDGELEAVMEAMGRRFVEWSRSDDNDRAPGQTCMTGCQNLAAGAGWRESGVAGSKGAGAPMRAVPIGLRYWRDRERLPEVARAGSLPTHGHPEAVEASAAVALAVALALDKRTPEQIHAALLEQCRPEAPELRRRLLQVPELLDGDPGRVLSEEGLGEMWVAEEAVAGALYCFWRSPADFRTTALTAANANGDSDTVGCIAGGLSGAFNGLDAIPAEWRDTVEAAPHLRELARGLHELR